MWQRYQRRTTKTAGVGPAVFAFELHFDFGIDASREGEVLQALDGLGGGV